MLKEVLTGVLTKEQRKSGLSLEEEADDSVLLKKGNRIVAVFTQRTTIWDIQQVTQKYL